MNEHSTAPNPPVGQLMVAATELTRRHLSGASWFFWIAGLSLINSVASHSGSDWGFMLGLGITQVIDVMAQQLLKEVPEANPALVRGIAVTLDLLVIGSFALWGLLARKRMRWAYLLGMILFTLDTLLLLVAVDIFGILLHLFALFCIFKGYQACGELKQILDLVASAKRQQDETMEQQPAAIS